MHKNLATINARKKKKTTEHRFYFWKFKRMFLSHIYTWIFPTLATMFNTYV